MMKRTGCWARFCLERADLRRRFPNWKLRSRRTSGASGTWPCFSELPYATNDCERVLALIKEDSLDPEQLDDNELSIVVLLTRMGSAAIEARTAIGMRA
jgi:hypothetical protein